MATDTASTEVRASGRAWREPSFALLVGLTVLLYFVRLTALPIRGEETTWATIAQEMIQSGDWIVPRVQGEAFVDRPPLHSWLMAGIGLLRGQVDLLAIRLPSVLAILLVSILLYVYCRTFLSPAGAFAAGGAFVTAGQVLDLGRVGENEAVFTLLISASLIAWHGCWLQSRRLSAWTIGYSLAALAAMQKGIQGPVYFVAATGAYLVWTKSWRDLFDRRHLAGIGVFAALLGSWLVPFCLLTSWQTGIDMWLRTVVVRLGTGGLIKHIATYPFETVACLLPWSAMFLALADRRVRQALGRPALQVQFAMIAIAITYPSVWFAAHARGRYFMPLYPLFAVVLGQTIETCALAAIKTPAHDNWKRMLRGLAIVLPGIGVFLLAASYSDARMFYQFRQPPLFAWLFLAFSFAVGYYLTRLAKRNSQQAAQRAIAAVAVFLLVGYNGAVINARLQSSLDLTNAVAEIKSEMDNPADLVSFGPIHPQFTYYYRTRIEQQGWPYSPAEVGGDVEYFCFSYTPGDNEQERRSGRWYSQSTTPGSLPFRWQRVAFVPCGRRLERTKPQPGVIIGKVIRVGDRIATLPEQESEVDRERPAPAIRQ